MSEKYDVKLSIKAKKDLKNIVKGKHQFLAGVLLLHLMMDIVISMIMFIQLQKNIIYL